MSDERSSGKKADTGGTDPGPVSIRASLLRKAEAVHARIGSTREAQKAKEKSESEPWYFTHT
jgi:hypothetical protein